jgi:Na+/H+ antiporter NhaD/arsenite permease-like protein
MSLATLSLIALLIAIVVSMVAGVNVGLLSMGFAFVVGAIGGMHGEQIVKAFPSDLFVILLGVSYMFSLAEVNGTLERLTRASLRLVRGNGAVIPLLFFILGTILSAIGPGAIPAIALLAAPAAAVSVRTGVPYFLVGVCLMHGAISGTMSPIAPMGVVAAKIVQPMVGNISMRLFLDLFVANIIIAVIAYFIFGGPKLIARFRDSAVDFEAGLEQTKWEAKQIATVVGIVCLVVAAIIFKLHIGFTAIAIGVIIAWFDKSDDKKALKSIKWDTILMVTGVMILIGLMRQTGGLEMIGQGVASFTTPETAPAVLAFVAGLISIYSSTTGVVLPAFLPMVQTTLNAVGGGDLLGSIKLLVLSANVVDASPMSTLGALVLASTPALIDKNKMFRNLMLWGLAMAFVGTIVGWVLYIFLKL